MRTRAASPAELFVSRLAAELHDGAVVATGVASPLAVLAIAVAQRTHAPNLAYLACVGSLNPRIDRLYASSEDLRYLEGRVAEISIPDLFDHARRGRVDTVFFGAAEVDGRGRSNLTAIGSLAAPTLKLPGVAGACSLRRWCKRPILLVPRQSRRNLVAQVQVVSTRDEGRTTPLFTDLARFELGEQGATLLALEPGVELEEVRERTGFSFAVAPQLLTLPQPTEQTLSVIRALDPERLRDALVGGPTLQPERQKESAA
jgi:glutaconate CoA-transferase, subunit B